MTRAEEAANKAYPPKRTILGLYSTGGLMAKDFSEEKRLGFIEGYEQAERDLALTWQDIRTINRIISELEDEGSYNLHFDILEKQFYEEVLKRFNNHKTK